MIVAKNISSLPIVFPLTVLIEQLHRWMYPFNDSFIDTQKGVYDALEGRPAPGGFIICATENDIPAGALVMLSTGMSGYIPPNLLLFLAVDTSLRGRGIGTKLLLKAIEITQGPIKLHVEAENPARKLYERTGFTASYIDMRLYRDGGAQ